jgi:hypothetical protein
VPSVLRAQLWPEPSATSTTSLPSVAAPACTGVLLFTVVPSPSSPEPLDPQHQSVPSFLRAQP